MPPNKRVLLRFCTVGLLNTIVDFGLFSLLIFVGVPYWISQILSYIAGVTNSFIFNRTWTFQVKQKTKFYEVAKFIVVNTFSLVVSLGLLYIFHDKMQMTLWISKVLASSFGIIVNYFGSRLWVFANYKQGMIFDED